MNCKVFDVILVAFGIGDAATADDADLDVAFIVFKVYSIIEDVYQLLRIFAASEAASQNERDYDEVDNEADNEVGDRA